jgi:hypothetical protein
MKLTREGWPATALRLPLLFGLLSFSLQKQSPFYTGLESSQRPIGLATSSTSLTCKSQSLSMAKALSRLIPNADCRMLLVIRHRHLGYQSCSPQRAFRDVIVEFLQLWFVLVIRFTSTIQIQRRANPSAQNLAWNVPRAAIPRAESIGPAMRRIMR